MIRYWPRQPIAPNPENPEHFTGTKSFTMNMNKIAIASILLFTGGFFLSKPMSNVSYGPGVIAPDEPRQSSTSEEPFYVDNIQYIPKASFDIEARVLSREDYSMDAESKVSPTDLALGWGRMSDEAILEQIDISQRNRFYYWRVEQFPIPRKEIEQNSANMHLIPADAYVAGQIDKVKSGELVRFSGYLVNLKRDDGWHWNSSLTRNDTGAGACEVVWVEDFEIIHNSEIEFH